MANAISQHIARTKEHFLLCLGVPISRTAVRVPQIYRLSEIISGGGDDEVKIYRSPSVVFSQAAMSSLEGKVIASPHPPVFINSGNALAYARGHAQNIRPATDLLDNGERALLADLVIYDESLCSQIDNDLIREVSVAYDAQYIPRPDGGFDQVAISGNHIAIVSKGRAGSECRIMDAKEDSVDWTKLNQQLDIILDRLTRATGGKPARTTIDGKRSLADEVESIRRSANLTERLTASGCGPGTFAEALARDNAAYDTYSREREAGDKFAADAKRAGQEMQEFYRPKACRKPVTQVADSETDWAERMNRAGARMRGK